METTTLSNGHVKYVPLPTQVTEACYRFFCRVLRQNYLLKTTTVDIDGVEVTASNFQMRVGIIEGREVCDINEQLARKFKLV